MRWLIGLTATALAFAGLTGCTNSTEEAAPVAFENQVGVQLFMWNWDSIAKECQHLSDVGIDYVLTSPVQEHIRGEAWWTVYQPVSYQIESRLGTRAEFQAMTSTCNDLGVAVIVDAVINHMSASDSGTGVAGTEYSKYEYPDLYTREDFHNCNLTPNDQIANYLDRPQVQTCELLGLSDLDHKSKKVQDTIVSYLEDLLSLGAAGFRIDAAKHIYAPDLKAIVDRLPQDTRIFHEVIRGGAEPIQPEEYLDSGDVWEFNYARELKGMFKARVVSGAASNTRFDSFAPSNQAISFVVNHDTERNGETLTYKTPELFELATALMLAENYGQPMLYSSYAFSERDRGPKGQNGKVLDAHCDGPPDLSKKAEDGTWLCQHRLTSTTNMIKFRDVVGSAAITEKFRAAGLYGFARDKMGYFLVNVSEYKSLPFEVQTTLPAGDYCNAYLQTLDCSSVISVDENGVARGEIPNESAIAIHLGALATN